MTYVERAHELMASSTCAVTDRLSVKVTPSTFSDVTRMTIQRMVMRVTSQAALQDAEPLAVVAENDLGLVRDRRIARICRKAAKHLDADLVTCASCELVRVVISVVHNDHKAVVAYPKPLRSTPLNIYLAVLLTAKSPRMRGFYSWSPKVSSLTHNLQSMSSTSLITFIRCR